VMSPGRSGSSWPSWGDEGAYCWAAVATGSA
jgi:hypothetical protein